MQLIKTQKQSQDSTLEKRTNKTVIKPPSIQIQKKDLHRQTQKLLIPNSKRSSQHKKISNQFYRKNESEYQNELKEIKQKNNLF